MVHQGNIPKELEDRYARILGSDMNPSLSPPVPSYKSSYFPWMLLCLSIFGIVLGLGFLSNLETVKQEGLVGKLVQPEKEQNQKSLRIPKIQYASEDESLDSSTQTEVVESVTFFVIIKSTKSKEDAIELAKDLTEMGYSSEVILSATGYYGVALGRYSFDNAKKAIKSPLVSGFINEEPFIMSHDRITAYIYAKGAMILK